MAIKRITAANEHPTNGRDRVEAQHASHTMEELEEVYFGEDFDKEKFFEGGKQILDAVAAFWDGLEKDRLDGVYTA